MHRRDPPPCLEGRCHSFQVSLRAVWRGTQRPVGTAVECRGPEHAHVSLRRPLEPYEAGDRGLRESIRYEADSEGRNVTGRLLVWSRVDPSEATSQAL